MGGTWRKHPVRMGGQSMAPCAVREHIPESCLTTLYHCEKLNGSQLWAIPLSGLTGEQMCIVCRNN